MNCPHCNHKLYVSRTIRLADGTTIRLYTCRNCNREYSSREVMVKNHD